MGSASILAFFLEHHDAKKRLKVAALLSVAAVLTVESS